MRGFQQVGSSLFLAAFVGLLFEAPLEAKPKGELHVELVDATSGEPIAARVRLRNSRGRPVRTRTWGLAPLGNHAYLDATATLALGLGAYRFDLDAGPEYRTLAGHFEIDRHANDTKRIEVRRFAHLADEGWIGGDLASARPVDDLPLLLRAEQLGYVATLGWRWDNGKWQPTRAAREQASPRCALWDDPRGVVWLHDPTGERTMDDLPETADSSVELLRRARQSGWHVIATPTSRELPLWLAHGLVDGVLVLDGWSDSSSGAAARKRSHRSTERRFSTLRGAGLWREQIYHQLLDAGLRLPAVGASGSGLNNEPIGSTRTYAYASSAASWWESLLQGATVMTNGPLLRPMFNGKPPGTTFALPPSGMLTLTTTLHLATRDPIDYLELIKNGKVIHTVRLIDWAEAKGELPRVTFDAPGWMLVRAVTHRSDRYAMASSSPCYVGPPGERVAAASVRFLYDWFTECRNLFGTTDPEAYDEAERYWQAKLEEAR